MNKAWKNLAVICLGLSLSDHSVGQDSGDLPRVVLLATGGTIAVQYNPDERGPIERLTGEDLIQAVPGLREVATVSVEQISNVGSRNITPDIWKALATRVDELLASSDIAGVVVTHGTDTLEETAYFLDLTTTSDKPVVVVGAQRNPSYSDTDGPRNLLDAVRVAVSPEARGKGALVVMNGQINAARDVTKTSTLNVETFKSLGFGPIGVADYDAVRFYRTPTRRQTIAIDSDVRWPRIEIVTQYAGADGKLIRLLLEDGEMDGLVIEGLGLGHSSSDAMDAIQEVREAGIPVVLSTRVPTGRLIPMYDMDFELREWGCIPADNLSPQKARILLMLAMTQTLDSAELLDYFNH